MQPGPLYLPPLRAGACLVHLPPLQPVQRGPRYPPGLVVGSSKPQSNWSSHQGEDQLQEEDEGPQDEQAENEEEPEEEESEEEKPEEEEEKPEKEEPEEERPLKCEPEEEPEEYDDTLLKIELLTDEIELLSDDDKLLKHEPESPQETAANTMPPVADTPPLSPASPAETVAPADDMRPWSPTSPHESAADTPAAHTPSRGQWLAGDKRLAGVTGLASYEKQYGARWDPYLG